MAKEIERKFLVSGDSWRALAKGAMYRQGYLNSAKERTVRIRTADEKAFLTIKGITVGAVRSEYEYEIPFDEGNAMLEELAEKPLIEKRRYKIPVAGVTWEIDEFIDGRMAGFESVLHKTATQVRTARARLAERSGLDTGELPRLDKRTFAE